MNSAEYAVVSRRPYSALLPEVSLFGKWFASRQLAFNMQAQTRSNCRWVATAASKSHNDDTSSSCAVSEKRGRTRYRPARVL